MRKHFTATAFIIDSNNRTLLLWHKRLMRWMPPGGHVDENETPEEAAARECKEETGLDVDIHGGDHVDLFERNPKEGQMLKKPIALLMELIPRCEERDEDEHYHMDFLYIARPVDESQDIILAEEEGEKMQWFTREEIEMLDENCEIFSNVKEYILRIIN